LRWSGSRSEAIQNAPGTAVAPERALLLDHSTSWTAPPQSRYRSFVDHERLDCYAVALELAAMVPEHLTFVSCSRAKSLSLVCPGLTKTARPSLRDQLERAAASVALTLADKRAPASLR
jgi:hypothetical protein